MTKEEKNILKKVIDSREGQINPSIMNSYAKGDQGLVERLVSKGYLERIYQFKEGVQKGTYSIIFYTVTEKGLMFFAPRIKRLWFNFQSQTTLWVGLISIIVSITALAITLYFSYLQNLRENKDLVLRNRPYLVISDLQPINIIREKSADIRTIVKNVGLLPAVITDSSVSCGGNSPTSASGKTIIGNGEEMIFNFFITRNLGELLSSCNIILHYTTAIISEGINYTTEYSITFTKDGLPIFENAFIQ